MASVGNPPGGDPRGLPVPLLRTGPILDWYPVRGGRQPSGLSSCCKPCEDKEEQGCPGTPDPAEGIQTATCSTQPGDGRGPGGGGSAGTGPGGSGPWLVSRAAREHRDPYDADHLEHCAADARVPVPGKRRDWGCSSWISSGMGMIRNSPIYPTLAGRMSCGGRDRRGGAAAFRAHDQVQRTCWLALSAGETCTSAGAGESHWSDSLCVEVLVCLCVSFLGRSRPFNTPVSERATGPGLT